MIRPNPFRQGFLLTVLALLLGVLLVPGCSHLQFGKYGSFDDWYVGREHPRDPMALGYGSLDGHFPGYVLNTLLIRTPVFVLDEGVRTVLVPVAVPYYAGRALVGGGEKSHEIPTESSN